MTERHTEDITGSPSQSRTAAFKVLSPKILAYNADKMAQRSPSIAPKIMDPKSDDLARTSPNKPPAKSGRQEQSAAPIHRPSESGQGKIAWIPGDPGASGSGTSPRANTFIPGDVNSSGAWGGNENQSNSSDSLPPDGSTSAMALTRAERAITHPSSDSMTVDVRSSFWTTRRKTIAAILGFVGFMALPPTLKHFLGKNNPEPTQTQKASGSSTDGVEGESGQGTEDAEDRQPNDL